MSASKPKRQQYQVGAIVKIKLDDEYHSYGRILEPPTFAFYASRSNTELPVEAIVSMPILFRIWVMKHAVTSGRWVKVGYLPLEPYLHEAATFFKQDALKPENFYLYRNGQEYPTTREGCIGLERAAVWEPEHVEERLRDYYVGRPNRWVELLKLPDIA